MKTNKDLKRALDTISERIHNACILAKRDPSSVNLLLATKTQPVDRINAAIELGYGLIGENRAQEVIEKSPHLLTVKTAITPRENHFIGHLQSNKIKQIFHSIDCFQSIDRISIAEKLNAFCEKEQSQKDILVQFNVSNEESKHGAKLADFEPLLSYIHHCNWLNVRGFMTIGLNSDDEQKVREGFQLLRALNEKAITQQLIPNDATHLSMGMSHDLEWAIQEGATIIRVGSAIFGERNYP